MEFTQAAFEHLVQNLKLHNFEISSCSEVDNLLNTKQEYKESRLMSLRHDVDLSLDFAMDFAHFEASLGIKATYCIQVRSEFYNVLENKSVGLIRELVNLGHEIGLHLNYDRNTTFDEITFQVNLLQSVTQGLLIRVISFHNPLEYGIVQVPNQILNTYSKSFFQTYNYLSDSCMAWREPDILQSILRSSKPTHLLLHPEYWRKENSDLKSRINEISNYTGGLFAEKYANYEKNMQLSVISRKKQDKNFIQEILLDDK